MRIDKYLADMGCGTRKELRFQIKKGLVTVDNTVITDPGFHVSENNVVTLSGKTICYSKYSYFMMNKPDGVVSATEDRHEQTVIDLLLKSEDLGSMCPIRKDIFPVGRLDKDTVGLLLLTNDGALAHHLLSPSHHVSKRYFAKVLGNLSDSDIHLFEQGIDIGDDKPTLPAKLEIKSSGEISEAEITIYEGRYHQVKRMFEAIGSKVIYLKRLSMGPLILDPTLLEGAFRPLTENELTALRNL